MKKIALLFCLTISLFSCDSDDNAVNRDNPFLFDPPINISLDLSLPEYNGLNFPGNNVIINQRGIKGVVVYNVNNDLYTAFELSDPNHIPNTCSRMDVNGILASCPCDTDENSYDIVTGQHQTNAELFPMQAYRVEKAGNSIIITN